MKSLLSGFQSPTTYHKRWLLMKEPADEFEVNVKASIKNLICPLILMQIIFINSFYNHYSISLGFPFICSSAGRMEQYIQRLNYSFERTNQAQRLSNFDNRWRLVKNHKVLRWKRASAFLLFFRKTRRFILLSLLLQGKSPGPNVL